MGGRAVKSLSTRELRLAAITLVVMLAGGTWTVARSQWTRLREMDQRAEAALLEQRRQRNMIRKRPELIRRLQEVRGQLPRHPEDKDLKPEFARQIQALAGRSGLQLTGLTPDPEEALPELNLYRSALRGTWTGSPEEVVAFLFQLQQLGAVADVRELRARDRSGNAKGLGGTFLIDFVYARIPGGEPDAGIDTSSQSSNDGGTE